MKIIRRYSILFLMIPFFAACATGPLRVMFEPRTSGTNASFRGLSAVDRHTVWASGSRGTVVRTTNGGSSWESFIVPGGESLDFRDIEAFDANTAVIISAGSPAKIYRTTDGGANWNEQYSDESPNIFYNSMDFWDNDNGIAVGDPIDGYFQILITGDGGVTWVKGPTDAMPPALEGEANFAASGTCLVVEGYGNVWFVTGGVAGARVFKSGDRGKTWSVSSTPILSGKNSQGIFSIAFRNRNEGIIVGGDYAADSVKTRNAAITNDGGVSWELLAEGSQPSGYRSCVAYMPETLNEVLLTVGTSGSDMSYNMGRLWAPVDTTGYHTISFGKTADSGWASGGQGRIAKIVRVNR